MCSGAKISTATLLSKKRNAEIKGTEWVGRAHTRGWSTLFSHKKKKRLIRREVLLG